MSRFPPTELREIAHKVAAALKNRGETICIAETVRARHGDGDPPAAAT